MSNENYCIKASSLVKKVTVESGQFAGTEAIFKEKDGEKRCILLIKILNQQTELRINNSDIKASC